MFSAPGGGFGPAAFADPDRARGRQATLRGLPAVVDASAVHTVPASPMSPASGQAVPRPVEDKSDSTAAAGRKVRLKKTPTSSRVRRCWPQRASKRWREMMRADPDDPALLQSSDLLPIEDDVMRGDEDTQPREDQVRFGRTASAGPAVAGGKVLAGDLTALPLFEVVDLIARQKLSGVLSVTATGRALSVYFLDGWIAQATAQGLPSLRLGRFLLELDGQLRQPEIDAVASQSLVVPVQASATPPAWPPMA